MEQTAKREVEKKSSFLAKTGYEYSKISFPQPYLVDMWLEEEKEELLLTYQTEGFICMSDIRNEDILTILAVLVNIESLKSGLAEYNFSLHPQNLFYDRNRMVRAKKRDIYPAGRGYDEEEFLDDYKALAGFALQKRYSYEDFKKGGKKLLAKNFLLNKIREAVTPEAVKDILLGECLRIEKERKEKKMLLGKGTYKGMKAGLIVLAIMCVASASYLGYRFLKEDPYKNAVIAADDAYIETDYVSCIDAMKEISVSDMELHQKYILANSYVRSENLTQEQKTNILETLSIKEAPVRLEYWIYLGRGDTSQAEDIAMQQSDDQLLLYAYMKEKSAIEVDTSITGEEKTQKLEEISTKMEPLMEQYDTTEEE
ncbi:MAG: type VII secretion protein EssB/YukC [Hespellia sp.]|nr:type VII secretion protein EssB/YukC [Hespellia sp.]